MKIALINENSQSNKNTLIYDTLVTAVKPFGHTVDNYGMYSQEDSAWLTYVQVGILGSLLLNSGAADYVVTGCGTGQGAMIALNAFPGVNCGLVVDPSDGYLFSQINDGNAISLPYAKGFGWGAECNLSYIFEKTFAQESGGGYPLEKREVERANKKILDTIKKNTFHPYIECLKAIDQKLLADALKGDNFKTLYFENCQNIELAEFVKTIVQ